MKLQLNTFINRIIVKDNDKRNIFKLHNKQPSLDTCLSNLQDSFRQFEADNNQPDKLCYEAILKDEYIAITINKENDFILQSYIDTFPELKLLSIQDIPFFINGNYGKTCIYKLNNGFNRTDLIKNTLLPLNMTYTFILPNSIVVLDGKKRAYSLVENTSLDITELNITKENNILLVSESITIDNQDVLNNDNEFDTDTYNEYIALENINTTDNIQEFKDFLLNKQVSIVNNSGYTLFLKNKVGDKLITENNFEYAKAIQKEFGKDLYISREFLNNNPLFARVIGNNAIVLKDGRKQLNPDLKTFKIDFNKLLDCNQPAFKHLATDISTILFVNKNSYNFEYDSNKDLFCIDTKFDGVYINLFDKEIWNKPKQLAKKGDWSLIKAHLENLTYGESGVLDYILYLYAFKMQKPNATFDIDTICILDEGGTGKSLLGKILNYIQNGNGEFQLFSKDKTSLIGKRFMYINEMTYNKEFTTELKKITENTIWSEQKYKNPILIKHSNLFHLFSNKANLMDYEESRRRWIILNPKSSLEKYLSSKFDGNIVNEYLNQLNAIDTNSTDLTLIHNQLNAFIYYLLNYDLSNKPAKPLTEATKQSNEVLNSSRILEYLDEISIDLKEASSLSISELNNIATEKLTDIVLSKSNRNIDLNKLNKGWQYDKSFKIENNCLVLYINKNSLCELTKKMFNTNSKTSNNHIEKLSNIKNLVSINGDRYKIILQNSLLGA